MGHSDRIHRMLERPMSISIATLMLGPETSILSTYLFPYMRASYYAIRERVPRNSKGAKAQGISLSNMTGHGRPTHPFFVRTRMTRTTLSHCLLISKTFSRIFIRVVEIIVNVS